MSWFAREFNGEKVRVIGLSGLKGDQAYQLKDVIYVSEENVARIRTQPRNHEELLGGRIPIKPIAAFTELPPEAQKVSRGCFIVCAIVASLVTLFAVGGLETCSSSGNSSPEKQQKRQAAASWLEQHYRNFPIGGGWRVSNIGIGTTGVEYTIEIPDSSAEGISQRNYADQKRIFETFFPSEREPVWGILPSGDRLTIHVSSPRKGLFLAVNSKSAP